ncbi:MAG: hypothetical protein JO356_08940 [Acidobacteria bacterium]|nr:hypothetical protein [Acidobacteriota bacterium]
MFPANWSSLVGNHLWQSTLFAFIAGLLTLALRKNHAGIRYGLWLMASLKFLIPFTLFFTLGTHLPGRRNRSAASGLYLTLEHVSQRFTGRTLPASVQVFSSAPRDHGHWLFYLVLTIWLAGAMAVGVSWYRGLRRISKLLSEATPLKKGRELEALERAERRAGVSRPIEIRGSSLTLEPAIYGIRRPALLWPRAISNELEDRHLEAILVHEIWHVRRRDNLWAAVHMFVEALFWFHPLVWWLGARLVEERERACDEAVLNLGTQREIYAESILKTCQFSVA